MTGVRWAFEESLFQSGKQYVAGVDEVGRGPLAGPVVAAAVVLPHDFSDDRVSDSKKLTHRRRLQLYEVIYRTATSVGIGIIDALEIDRINILQASLQAMAMAVDNLVPQPDYLLIDGKFEIPFDCAQQAIVKGDGRSISIAAASIVAKVTRDNMMQQYHCYYPGFGFDQHKGYPTVKHKQAIQTLGPCPIHRFSFRGVKADD